MFSMGFGHAGVTFDINFEVSVVPGPPYSWSIAIIDYQKGQAAAAKAAQPKDAEGNITCGQPFYMELEVIDQCHNRCNRLRERCIESHAIAWQ